MMMGFARAGSECCDKDGLWSEELMRGDDTWLKSRRNFYVQRQHTMASKMKRMENCYSST